MLSLLRSAFFTPAPACRLPAPRARVDGVGRVIRTSFVRASAGAFFAVRIRRGGAPTPAFDGAARVLHGWIGGELEMPSPLAARLVRAPFRSLRGRLLALALGLVVVSGVAFAWLS